MAEKKNDSSSDKVLHELKEHNVTLLKKNIELIEATTELNKRVDKLISIFEKASEKVNEVETADKGVIDLTNKLESLLEQNRVIAKGLIMLEKYVRNKQQFEQPFPNKNF
jgi:hypothetical protein